jgi:hypothetical protein
MITEQESSEMARRYSSTFTVADWDERELPGGPHAPRHTATHYAVSYFGEVSGTSTIDLIMVYTPGGDVPYTGYEFFEGQVGRRSGTIVFAHSGVYDGDGATSQLRVVDGTATGDFAEAKLSGHWFAPPGGDGSMMIVDETD